MRKVFLTIFVLLLALPIFVYTQAPSDPNLSLSSPSVVDFYRTKPLEAHRQSLQNFNAENEIYQTNSPVSKMGTGLVNTTTGWTDVPLKMSEESGKTNPLIGWTVGFGQGLAKGAIRTGAGIYDVITFALPPYDEPIMQPEHKVEKPDQGFKIDILKW